ncbi:hypothetical protein EYF80_059318 [Liparis tanakae]|uniref:Uncharacterized protein n=1 Tax=Liparis tanakae TaxID=230148 RepID=A0A4Z2EPJ9_9TELE|nr:hypothetical protein EYF80_059318 [Liparis tanakae]
MDLNLLSTSLCSVMSVARMHLQRRQRVNPTDPRGPEQAQPIRGRLSLDDPFSYPLVLIHGQNLKGHGTVVVLQWRDVVVAEGEVGASVDLKRGHTDGDEWVHQTASQGPHRGLRGASEGPQRGLTRDSEGPNRGKNSLSQPSDSLHVEDTGPLVVCSWSRRRGDSRRLVGRNTTALKLLQVSYQLSKVGVFRYCLTSSDTSRELRATA